MDNRDVLYAVVGAPITAAKTIGTRAENIWAEIEKRSGTLGETAQRRLDEWANEGRQVVNKVSDGKMVDELTSKVDFDQAREQVSKLRDQLEEMLATWRTSFRPAEESAGNAVRAAAGAVEATAEKVEKIAEEVGETSSTKTTTRTTGSKPAAKKPVAKKPVAKKPGAKKPAAKKPAAKKPAAKATSQKAS